MRYQLHKHLFFYGDINYTNARSLEAESNESYTPLAPEWSSSGGLPFKRPSGFQASWNYRYIKDRLANEDFSIKAEGYFTSDFSAAYNFKSFRVGLQIENLFDQEWNEAQFATESRLRDEAAPVEELHFTAGTPFFLKGSVQ